MIEVLRDAGVEVRDQPVLSSALGLPDVARVRLLVDHDDLFHVYCAENLPSSVPASRVKDALRKSGDESLLLMDRGGERVNALHMTADGEDAQRELSDSEVAKLLPNVQAEEGEDPFEVSERVRELILNPVEEQEAYRNRGLFSDDYLTGRLTEPGQYSDWQEDVSGPLQELRKLYDSKKGILEGLNEAQTENEFLDEALKILGFSYIKQTTAKDGSRPDYALYPDEGAKNAALGVKNDPTRLYATSLAVTECKYWGRNLDVYTKKDDKDDQATVQQKAAPAMQISRYLQETGLSWGILTNGSEWRLYHGESPGKTKRYYSVDLTRALENEGDFRLIEKGAEGRSFLDRVRAGSEDYAVRVGKELKKVVFERLFARLAAGFLKYHTDELRQPVDEETLSKTYRGTLALLYRLLFLLYAEARDLLPHKDRLGYGVHSITSLKKDVAGRIGKSEKFSDKSYVIWERLESLFRIVDEGSQELNVPPYNGGLFKDAGSHEFLGTHRVSDRHLAPALDELSRQADEGGDKRFVDYGFIGVRELGSVYEGLLEFSLRIADEDLVVVKEKGKEIYVPKGSQGRKKVLGGVDKGAPYLVNDKKERKATGSYYTPRYIVDYIVENTLEPLVAGRREALEARLAEIAKLRRELGRMRKNEDYIAGEVRKMEALRTLLDVKVLDPAMGSGHFLVAAVDYLTDEFSRIISELDAAPVVEELAELRAEIRESLEAYGATASQEQLSDDSLLKRMVLKRCVYGIDQNEMAVELAKLSLWLDAFTVGAPLSFLDHHLKQGNSLIGSSVREVRREVETSGSLLGNQFTATLIQGTELMQHVGEIPDATEGEVRESIDAYATADKVLAPYKHMLDIWTSQHFGNSRAQNFLSQAVSTGDVDHLTRGDYGHFTGQDEKTIDAAIDLSADKQFFHWELEFPEVFYEGSRERENPGFDAVVGNPPYDVLKRDRSNPALNHFIDYVRGMPRYEPAIARILNLFQIMLVQASDLCSRSGLLSMIVPMSLLSDQSTKGIRELLFEKHALEAIQAFPQKDDENDRVFPEAKLSTIVLVARTNSNTETLRCRVHPGKDILESSPLLEIEVADVRSFDPENLTVPLGSPEEVSILQRMFAQEALEPLSSIASVAVGEIDMTQDRNCKQSETTQHELLKGAHLQRYFKRPYPKQGQREWVNLAALKQKYGENSEKLTLHERERLAFQGVTGTDDSRRLKASLIPTGYFLANSLNYFNILESSITMEYILAVFNSQMFEWRFRLTSTNNNVNNYEVHSLPIRRIEFTTPQHERTSAVSYARDLYETNEYPALLNWVEQELVWNSGGEISAYGRNDTIHDLLSHIAAQINAAMEKRGEIQRVWRQWVETIVPTNNTLTKTFLNQRWVEIGLEHGWEGVEQEFQVRNAIPNTGKRLQELRRETEEALEELGPFYKHVQEADGLIDQIVYRLYGLTEEEISVVEASLERG
jgi:hypothetical protein